MNWKHYNGIIVLMVLLLATHKHSFSQAGTSGFQFDKSKYLEVQIHGESRHLSASATGTYISVLSKKALNEVNEDIKRLNLPSNGTKSSTQTFSHRFEAAFKGDMSKNLRTNSTTPDNRTLEIYNGEEAFTGTYNIKDRTGYHNLRIEPKGTKQVFLSLYGFKDCYFQKFPSELISSGLYKFEHTEQSDEHGMLYCFSFDSNGVRGKSYLAPKRDGLVVRHEYFVENKRFTREILQMRQIKQAWAPQHLRHYGYYHNSQEPNSTINIVFDKISLNDVSNDEFEYQFKSGYQIMDVATRTTWRLGPNGEKIYNNLTVKRNQATMQTGWLFTASVTTLLILTVFAYVRWKRKQWAKRSETSKSSSET